MPIPTGDPVFLFGLDAVEFEVVERLIAEGKMPHLEAFRKESVRGRLMNKPQHFLSLVWSTFFTSSHLEEHGWFFNKLWNCNKQRIEYADPSWLPQMPFWCELEDKFKVAVLDVPYVAQMPTGPNDSMLGGWQCHDHFGEMELPSGLIKRLQGKYGNTKMTPEIFGPQSAETLVSLKQEVLDTTVQFKDIIIDYIETGQWDMLLAVFGGVHRGSHYLWDLSQIDTSGLDEATRMLLSSAQDDCYMALDDALGEIFNRLPDRSKVVTFALHGMGENLGWYEKLPAIIEHIHRGGGEAPEQKKGLVFRLKKALPWKLVRQITRRIPHSWNRALVPFWSRRMYDWASTRYFCLPMDFNGYVRFNIKGREKQGIVDPAELGAEIEALELALKSFRDIETGKPIFKGLVRICDLVDSEAPRSWVLPDVIILWATDFPTSESSGVVSDSLGEVRWPKGAKLKSGRSGNHTPNGWFAARGAGLAPGDLSQYIDTIDLAPTIVNWMGAKPGPSMKGKVVEELVSD